MIKLTDTTHDGYFPYRRKMSKEAFDLFEKNHPDKLANYKGDVDALRQTFIDSPNLRRASNLMTKEDIAKGPVHHMVYAKIVSGFMKYLMSKVIDGFDVKMGAKLGILGVRGTRLKPFIGRDGEVKGLSPSWAKTRELRANNPEAKTSKELVYCFNEHSNGIRYKLIWNKRGVLLSNKVFYSLAFSRANKRALWKAIMDGKEYEVTETKTNYPSREERGLDKLITTL